jgi:hypothetical protein
MRILEIKAYQYDELSDAAKARARDWWRAGQEGDNMFAEPIITDAVEVASRLGIEFKERIIRTLGGKQAAEPCIWFSVGGCQGDGASFEGRYTPAGSTPRASIRDYAPQDFELRSIAEQLAALIAKHGDAFVIEISQGGYYEHSGTMNFEASYTAGDGAGDPGLLERTIAEDFSGPLRQFADWIYRRLESAHDDYFSDDQVAGAIRASEYEFTADGSRCAVLN